MDEDSQSVLIGAALFLQSERPTTLIVQDYPWFRRNSSRSQNSFSGLVRGFLDSMALLLVPPGAEAVVGCCLDLPLADRPANLANQGAPKRPVPDDTAPATGTQYPKTTTGEGYPDRESPTFTLRIARSGQFTASDDQQQKDFAAKIINFLQTGTSDNRELVLEEILLRCRGKIMNCILGNNPKNSRISQFSSIIQLLADSSPPEYIPELENFPYASKSGTYTPQTVDKAFKRLVGDLREIAEKMNAVSDGEWSSVSFIITAAAGMRCDAVFMALLDESLPTRDAHKAKRFLERLAAYEIAIETLRRIFRKRRTGHPLFTSKIAISLLPPNHMSFQPPTLEELSRSVMSAAKRSSLRIPLTVCESYTSISTDVDLEEHCEIQLVRFYIENPDAAPVLPYLGISKLSCYQCSLFLSHLEDPEFPGVPVKFRTRGEQVKFCGRWLPPYDIRATEAIRGRVLDSLQFVAHVIRTRLNQSLELFRCKGKLLDDDDDDDDDDDYCWSSDSSGFTEEDLAEWDALFTRGRADSKPA